jgi:hypothetical protein
MLAGGGEVGVGLEETENLAKNGKNAQGWTLRNDGEIYVRLNVFL